MEIKTADLCDNNEGKVKIVSPMFQIYGGIVSFSGPMSTLKVHEDNVLVKNALSQPGTGKVLVVDGGGSLRCALLGDQLAVLAAKNGWAGIVVNGCIRDSVAISKIAIGVRALNTHPLKSIKKGAGDVDIAVTFGGVAFVPGHYLYADEDGVIVSETSLG
jgi:regulator of ribonuclease activity A